MLKVGLILYSVRDMMKEDPLAAVEAVGKLGYKNVELCNQNALEDFGCGFGLSAEALKAKLDEYGSKVVSAHVSPVDRTDLSKIAKYNSIIGNRYVVMPNDKFTTYDELMRQCENYSRMGRQLYEEGGIKFIYHNHIAEFYTFNGKTILELIAENTDPDYVGLEIDTFWVMRSGHKPVEILKKFGKRVKLLHQKDFAWDSLAPINLIGIHPEDYEMKPGVPVGANWDTFLAVQNATPTEQSVKERAIKNTAFTEIGNGIMDIQTIIDTANEYTDAEYIILEQDQTRLTQFESISRSMDSFKKFRNISWEA